MFEIKDAYLVDCHEFSRFIKEHYDRNIDLIEIYAPDMGNDSYLSIDVSKEGPNDWYPQEDDLASDPEDAMKKWASDDEDYQYLERELGISADLILWDLCKKDIIPEGTYIITIWW